MRLSTASLLVGALAASEAAATWNLHAPSYGTPNNSNNKCDDKQKSGFDWDSLTPGQNVGSYGGFNFNGFKCSNKFGKRDELTKRTFQSKCITGSISKGSSSSGPNFSCSDRGFSIDEFQVSVSVDIDVEFHYTMEDNSICKQTHSCSKWGTSVKNTQCGGAKSVTFKVPDHSKESGCDIGIHHVGFNCNPGYGSSSSKSLPSPTPSSSPVYTPPAYTSVKSTPVESTPIETPVASTSASSSPVESVPAESTPVYSSPAESSPAVSSTLTEATGVSSTPVETPVSSTPVETPASSTPFYSIPANSSTPAGYSTPAESTPVETPVVSTPVYSSPAESTPVESTPGYSSPAESTPVESTPVASTPAEYTPVPSPSDTCTPSAELPEVLPRCFNTWMLSHCKDNADYSCYCQDADFAKNIYDCVSAWESDSGLINQALSYFVGLCANYVPQNPGLVSNCPGTVTLAPTYTAPMPAGCPASSVPVPAASYPAETPVASSPAGYSSAPAPEGTTSLSPESPSSSPAITPAPSSPAGYTPPAAGYTSVIVSSSVKVTTITVSQTVTVPCTVPTGVSAGFSIPGSSTTSIYTTTVTVPQVAFTTTTITLSGTTTQTVNVVPGTPAPVSATLTAPYGNGAATSQGFGTVTVPTGTATATGNLPVFTGAAHKGAAPFAGAALAAVFAVFAL